MRKSCRNVFRPISLQFGRRNVRAQIGGELNVIHKIKTFGAQSGTLASTISYQSRTFKSFDTVYVLEEGCLLQSYWMFQYNIDVGGLAEVMRDVGYANTRLGWVRGTKNFMTNYAVTPARSGSGFDVSVQNQRSVGSGRGPWSWDFSPTPNLSRQGNNWVLVPQIEARLPVQFSGAVAAGVGVEFGVELSFEPAGIGVAGSVGGSASQEASINLQFDMPLDTNMVATITIPNEPVR